MFRRRPDFIKELVHQILYAWRHVAFENSLGVEAHAVAKDLCTLHFGDLLEVILTQYNIGFYTAVTKGIDYIR